MHRDSNDRCRRRGDDSRSNDRSRACPRLRADGPPMHQVYPCLLSPLLDVGPRAYNATVTECDGQIGARITFAVGTIGVVSGIAFCKSQTSAGIRDRTALRELRSGYKVA